MVPITIVSIDPRTFQPDRPNGWHRMISPGFEAWVQRAKAVHIGAVLRQRNIKLYGRGGNLAGPCPVCGGTDRFAVHLSKQLFNCRSCGGKGHGAVSFVMFADGVGFNEAIKRINNSAPPTDGDKTGTISDPLGNDDAKRTSAALRLWREAGPIEGTIGIRYLERERSIFDLPPDPHNVLRFHRRCVFGHDKTGQRIFHGCVLALYRDIVTNEPTGIHRIALDANGKLIGRMGLGRKQGSAIKFWDDSNVSIGLVVGEGVETVLAAAMHVQHKGTTLRPAWSLVDASNLERFPILGGLEHLTILADADANNRGQQAARTCAKRWAEAGRQAEVLIPDQLGYDFNDVARQWQRRIAS
jgi:phage/plasmid primase-like uncharacterized protein